MEPVLWALKTLKRSRHEYMPGEKDRILLCISEGRSIVIPPWRLMVSVSS